MSAPTAPSKRKPLRLKAAERLANPLAPRKVHRPEAVVDDSFIQSKRDKQLIRHSSFVSRIAKAPGPIPGQTPSSRKNQKRRENGRKKDRLHATLESLADALPELTADEVATGEAEAAGRIRHRSLRSKPGALKRKERVVRGEMERFGVSLAQLSSVPEVPVVPVVPGDGPGAGERMVEDGGADENKAPVQSTANRFAALRGFIAATMDQNPAFAAQHRAIGGNGAKGA
ncbi:hypothetical protein VSDG_08446 [Cytospora chrysosperma]|uniref:Ribosome biogenesis protein SLX9 n=1 Tax=Cytospora chrysosperma TaxID=252740 RepID=A0A423VHI9_CYTCH|nr:hypothetical protein VSDG_08446 [Valsa sordida]